MQYIAYIFAEGEQMESIKRGRILVIIMISVCLTVTLFCLVFMVSSQFLSGETLDAINTLKKGLISFILEVSLFFLLFIGHKGAKTITTVLFGLGVIISLANILITSNNILFFILLFIFYTTFFIILLLKSVRAFLKSQREKRLQEKTIKLS